MSLLSGGRLSGRAKAVLTAAVTSSLMVFGLVTATPASAATGCTASGGLLTITLDATGNTAVVFADANNQVWTQFNIDPDGAGPGAPNVPFNCGGVQLLASLTNVTVTSTVPGTTATFTIGMYKPAVGAAWPGPACTSAAPCSETSWGSTKFAVNLGADTIVGLPTTYDTLVIDNSFGNHGSNLTGGVSGIDLETNGTIDVVGVPGVKVTSALGTLSNTGTAADTNNTINFGGDTVTGAAFTGQLGYPPSTTQNGLPGILGGIDPNSTNTLTGGAGNDFIVGNQPHFQNIIAGGAGTNVLNAEGQSFALCPTAPACTVVEGVDDTADIVTYAASTVGVNANLQTGVAIAGAQVDNLMLAGPANNSFERVYGSPQADTLTGDDQPNRLRPSKGDDVVSGGANIGGFDLIDYADLSDGVTVDLVAGTASGTSAGKDTFSGIEGVRGSTGGEDVVTDNALQNNYYRLEGGDDTLTQGADCATIADADQIDMGDGVDTLSYADRTDDLLVNVNLSATAPPGAAANGDLSCGEADTFFNAVGGTNATVENVVLGSGNDEFVGSPNNNTVWPNGGQNVLAGGPAPVGGVAFATGIDTVNYSMGYGKDGVTINLAGGGPTSGNQDSITGFTNAVGSPGPDDIIGTDTVAGTNGANSLKGAKGNDTISANAGPDSVIGGAGADNIRLGSGDDSGKGSDGNDNIRGGNGDDNIKGGKGKDKCDGGPGSDIVKCEKKVKKSKAASRAIGTARLNHLAVAVKP